MRTERRGAQLVDLEARRRERRGAARRWTRRLVAILIAVVLVGGVAIAAWPVGEVRVVGAERLAATAVLDASGVRAGERFWLVRPGAVSKRVGALAGVRAASVSRAFPATVEIRVAEREPLLRLGGRPHLAVGRDGVIFRLPEGTEVPELHGWRGRPREGERLDERSVRFLTAYAGFPAALRAATRTVGLGETLELVVGDGLPVRFGPPTDLAAKGAAAAAVLHAIEVEGRAVEYVDVRVPSAPVAKELTSGDEDGSEDPEVSAST